MSTATPHASIVERDRRFSMLDRLMAEHGLDAVLLTSTAQQAHALAVRYLANFPVTTRRSWVFARRGDEPYLIVPSPIGQVHARRQSWVAPERVVVAGDVGAEVHRLMEASGLLHQIRATAPVVGVYEPDDWPAATYVALKESGVRLFDITSAFTAARAPKSEWELDLIRLASTICVASFADVVSSITPGQTEWQIMGRAEGFLRSRGVEETLLLCRTSPPHGLIARATEKRLGEDDVFVYSAEIAGPGGYWTQLIRPIFMDRSSRPETRRLLRISREALDAGVRRFRPGNTVGDIAVAIEEVAAAEGVRLDHWSGHGMGADLGDGIGITSSNTMPIVPNMVLTIHPCLAGESDGLIYGNTYAATRADPINLTAGFEESADLGDLRAQARPSA